MRKWLFSILAVCLLATSAWAGRKKPAPPALPDYAKAPWRLLSTNEGWGSIMHPGVFDGHGSMDFYADSQGQDDACSGVIFIFKTADGREFYAEWRDYRGKIHMFRGYWRHVHEGPWLFEKELPFPNGE